MLNLCRFNTTKGEFVSLKTYKERASGENIYYIIGNDLELLKNSPLLEKYIKDDIEVLLLNDEVDSFIMPSLGEFEGLKFKDISIDESKDEVSKELLEDYKDFLDKVKGILSDKVKDVKLSTRLDKSPSCVISEGSNPMMEQLMRQMGQEVKEDSPVFEINPNHEIIKKLKDLNDNEKLKDVIFVLFDSAKLLEKGTISDANSFAQRVNKLVMMSV